MNKNLNTLVRAISTAAKTIHEAADAFVRAEMQAHYNTNVVKMPVSERVYTDADLPMIEASLVKFENGKANAWQTLRKMGGDMESCSEYQSLKGVLKSNGYELIRRKQRRA